MPLAPRRHRRGRRAATVRAAGQFLLCGHVHQRRGHSVPGLSTGGAPLLGAGYVGGPPGPYNAGNTGGGPYLGSSRRACGSTTPRPTPATSTPRMRTVRTLRATTSSVVRVTAVYDLGNEHDPEVHHRLPADQVEHRHRSRRHAGNAAGSHRCPASVAGVAGVPAARQGARQQAQLRGRPVLLQGSRLRARLRAVREPAVRL